MFDVEVEVEVEVEFRSLQYHTTHKRLHQPTHNTLETNIYIGIVEYYFSVT
jgi:hypothetical protein